MLVIRIIVFSDTHGNYSAMHKVFKRNGDADLFIFLGDGESDLKKLRVQYLDKKILSVAGNCDFMSDAPSEFLYSLPDGKKIFFTHGHKYGVNWTTNEIFFKGKELGADIVLFGHTHCRQHSYEDNIHLLNPGSAGCPRDGLPASYAFIDITQGGIFCAHVDL